MLVVHADRKPSPTGHFRARAGHDSLGCKVAPAHDGRFRPTSRRSHASISSHGGRRDARKLCRPNQSTLKSPRRSKRIADGIHADAIVQRYCGHMVTIGATPGHVAAPAICNVGPYRRCGPHGAYRTTSGSGRIHRSLVGHFLSSVDLGVRIRECEQLVYRAAYFTDRARWEDLAALFAEDGKLIRPSDPDHPVIGRAEILASLRARPLRVTRHILSNIMVDVHSPSHVHISSTVTLFTGYSSSGRLPVKGQKIFVGTFEDYVVATPNGLIFTTRHGSMALEYDRV
jgi:hypothetical protein